MKNQAKDSRIISAENIDLNDDISIRPQSLDEFIGQSQIKNNLKVFIEAAKLRSEAVDHILFYGPPGLGKTTLARVIANEMNVNIKTTSGPMLSKVGELAALLTNLEKNDVLFIDEIHRLSSSIEEVLYPAMEDYCIDIIVGDGPAARTVKIELPKFTLIGATTRTGLLSNPLKDRFGIPLKLDFYSIAELAQVIVRGAKVMNFIIDYDAAEMLARASRGTPRIACRLLRRIRDFADYNNLGVADVKTVEATLVALKIDTLGLDIMDLKYLHFIENNYQGGPVGVDTLAAALSEERDTLEDSIEPYLIKMGFITKTPRGRVLTQQCIQYLNSCK